MNPWTMLANALQALPPSIRRTLYSIVTAAGAVLAIAQIAGWKSIGPIDMDAALKTDALISSPTGVLALANVKPEAGEYDEYDDGYDEGYDGLDGFDGFDGFADLSGSDADDRETEGSFS